MITKLSIANFKSIKQLDLDCKKINVFIGEPNTGKSNILEVLALLSWCGRQSQPLCDYVRFELMQYLFYDGLAVDSEIRIIMTLSSGQPTAELHIRLEGDSFAFHKRPNATPFRLVNHKGELTDNLESHERTGDIKFYRFRDLARYDESRPGSLQPPDGANLFSAVYTSKVLRETMAEFFRKYELKVVMKPHEKIFAVQKEENDIIIDLPYILQSDTLRRIIFYTVAIVSNKDSVLVFEEPESNAFPYYTRYLGKRITSDETNQFFIATHNPYLLSAIVEKGRQEDVQVFVTYIKDYQTRVKALTPDEVSELMEGDPFFDLDRFTEEDR